MKTNKVFSRREPLPLASLTSSQGTTLSSFIQAFKQKLGHLGAGWDIQIKEDWALVSILSDGKVLSLAIAEHELPGLSSEGAPVRFGLDLAFGLPSGEQITVKPEAFFYLPNNYDVYSLIELTRGEAPPSEFCSILNFSTRYAMSIARDRFPSSILLMITERTKKLETGSKWFELWSQAAGQVRIQELPLTSNPFVAAEHALDVGCTPTIYRCQSGQFVAFKSTNGGVFL